VERDTTFESAFAKADEVLLNATQGISELITRKENFAGLGTYLSCGYAQYIERNWWETAMKLYGFPTRQWDLSGYYNRNGREWSAGGKFFKNANYIDSGNLLFAKIEAESVSVQRYYSGAVLRDTMDIEKNFASAEYLIGGGGFFYGVAAAYLKKSVLAHRDSTSSNSAARWLPLMFRISYFSRKFFQTRNVDNFSRIEDIPTGISATISAGYDFKKSDGNISKKIPLYLELCGAAIFKNSYHYVGLKMEKKYDYEIESIKFRSFAPVDSSKIFRFGIGADVVWLQSDCGDRYFIADGRTGFRGFPAYYEVDYDDNPFLKLSAEVRIFPQFEIFTLRPGIALFADAGGTYWGKVAEDFHKNSGWMTDFGVSFRICSTRSSRGNVNRFEISYSPQTRTVGFTIDSGQALSFYRQFDLNPSTGD
ncbi:hypothetical protein J7M00_06755, partial [bacterium]|nr:hypothetical protein [bacterium]